MFQEVLVTLVCHLIILPACDGWIDRQTDKYLYSSYYSALLCRHAVRATKTISNPYSVNSDEILKTISLQL